MKKTHYLATIVLITILCNISCDQTNKEKVESASMKIDESKEELGEAKEALMEAKGAYKDEVENYRIETNNKISDNEKKLQDYKLKISSDKSSVTKAHQLQINSLEEKNLALKNRLNAFVAGDKLLWNEFKTQCEQEAQSLDVEICSMCKPRK